MFGFFRSGLRRMSVRWPPKVDAIHRARRKYTGPNKRQKWEVVCERCGGVFKLSEVQAHHLHQAGALKAFSDLPGFVERLFCEADGFIVVCSKCHDRDHEKEKDNA